MIKVRLAAPRRAVAITGLILGAAALRALLLPAGDLFSTLVFAGCLLGISLIDRADPTPPATVRRGGKGAGAVGTAGSVLAGLAVGAVLLIPVVSGPLSARPLSAFVPWAVIAALVATLEEASIRGALYRRWADEAGAGAAIVIGAAVFALVHLPRYGLGAMPLDGAVGLALGGLRAITGRVFPCAVAHTLADWGGWLWS